MHLSEGVKLFEIDVVASVDWCTTQSKPKNMRSSKRNKTPTRLGMKR